MKSFIQYLQESGLKKALDTGDTAMMQKELAKRTDRLARLEAEATRLNQLPGHRGALAAHTKFAQAGALKPGIEDLTMPLEAQGIKTGVKLRELPTEKPWDDDMTPDQFDGLDADNTGSAEEVQTAQQQNQYTGNIKPFPTPSEMASQFFTQGRKNK